MSDDVAARLISTLHTHAETVAPRPGLGHEVASRGRVVRRRRRLVRGFGTTLVLVAIVAIGAQNFGRGHQGPSVGTTTSVASPSPARAELQIRPVLAVVPAASASVSGSTPALPGVIGDAASIPSAVLADFRAGICPTAQGGGAVPDPTRPLVRCVGRDELVALGPAEVAGPGAVTGATASQSVGSTWTVDLSLSPSASRAFARMTERAVNLTDPGNRLAVLVGDTVVSAPRILDVIQGASLEITGNFTKVAAQDLARSLRSAGTPAS